LDAEVSGAKRERERATASVDPFDFQAAVDPGPPINSGIDMPEETKRYAFIC
jgi:hypothetical protein